MLAEQAHGVDEQVVEVHRPGGMQSALVLGVHLGVLAVEDVLGAGGGCGRVDELVLPEADRALHAARREPLAVEAEVADHVAGQASRVRLVVDRELAGVAEQVGMGPQDAHAGRVERGDPHRLGDRPDELGDAPAHLVGGLVGERDREDRRRRNALVDEVGDAMREHPRLARSGAGDDEQRPAAMDDGIELVGVEPGKRVHSAAVASRRWCRGDRSRETSSYESPVSMAGVIRLPEPCLVVLVGPAGCGKSTWAARSFRPDQVISSDRLRAMVGTGERTSAPARRRSRCSISSSITASAGG